RPPTTTLFPYTTLFRSADGFVQNGLRFRIGVELLSFFDADRLQHADHRAIAVDPRLVLHEAVECLEEAQVVGNSAVEDSVDCIRSEEHTSELQSQSNLV